MNKNYCYLCQVQLEPTNISEEHIVPNSIGGRKVSKCLLCVACNGALNPLDAALAEMLNPFMIRFNISRDRGTPPPVKATDVNSGEKVFLEWGGKSKLIEPIINMAEGYTEIVAGSRKRMLQEIQRLKRDKPNIDLEKVVEASELRLVEIDSVFHISVQQETRTLQRALAKIAVNQYLAQGGLRETVSKTIDFVAGKSDKRRALIGDFGPEIKMSHEVIICGFEKEKRLTCDVKLLGILTGTVNLSDEYIGPDFSSQAEFNVKVVQK